MPVRTTVDIPEPLYQTLRERAHRTNVSIRSLVVRALEDTYRPRRKGRLVTEALIKGTGKHGPLLPTDENPYDLILP
jgi:hypothetical protein